MSLRWSSTDSSRQWDDSAFNTSSAMQNEDAGSSQASSSRTTGGLQAIDDFDFETLIELLGSSSKNKEGADVDEGVLRGVERSLGDISNLTLDPGASTAVAGVDTADEQSNPHPRENGDARTQKESQSSLSMLGKRPTNVAESSRGQARSSPGLETRKEVSSHSLRSGLHW